MSDQLPSKGTTKDQLLAGSRYFIRKDVTSDGEPIYVLYRHSWCLGQEATVEKARNRSRVVLEDAKKFLETGDE